SYYDYYQPEAYIPRSDTYIEKDSSRNEEIDKMRHAATRSLFERRDVLIVASVSCIYGLGAPVDYGAVIDKMRHAATRSLFERRDVLIVASVSCIYGLGAPVDYGAVTVRLRRGERERRDKVLRHLVDIQYARNDQA